MAWEVEPIDALTRDGRKATYLGNSDSNWPAPWKFSVDGNICWYSIGGFVGNHQLESHPLDLVGPWGEPLLDFSKPKRARSPEEHAVLYSSDTDVPGTYVPNMSDADKRRWKAKHVNKGKPDARIEARKTFDHGTNLVIIVALDGWNFKSETRKQGAHWGTLGKNVRISINGPLILTFEEFEEIRRAVDEAHLILLDESP